MDMQAVAELIVNKISEVAGNKEKDVSRVRISAATLCRIAGLPYLNDAFFAELDLQLGKLGYSSFRLGNFLGVVRTKTVTGWLRVKLDLEDD